MAHTFKIATELVNRIQELRSDLEDEQQEHRDAFDERSDAWREGEKGEATDVWIDHLGELIDALDNVELAPDI